VALAINVSVPEGFVSEAEYVSITPLGRPVTETIAVSLAELILIRTITGVPPCDTTTEAPDKVTEMGAWMIIEASLPPHPVAVSAIPPKRTTIRMMDPDRIMMHITAPHRVNWNHSMGRKGVVGLLERIDSVNCEIQFFADEGSNRRSRFAGSRPNRYGPKFVRE
jgi:hypothetical protein